MAELTMPQPEPIKKQKPLTQSEKILKQLRDAGPKGVPNYELASYNLGYRGRITELRKDGYGIYCLRQKIRGRATGVFIYYLMEAEA